MHIETVKTLAGGSVKLSGSTGISTMIMAYFQVNAAGIGALCTLISLIGYFYFQWLAQKKENQSAKNKKDLESLESEFIDHRKETSNQLSCIIKKLEEKETPNKSKQ